MVLIGNLFFVSLSVLALAFSIMLVVFFTATMLADPGFRMGGPPVKIRVRCL